MNVVWSTKTVSSWRFGATVAVTCGKGSAGKPPLRHREAAPKATRHPVARKCRERYKIQRTD